MYLHRQFALFNSYYLNYLVPILWSWWHQKGLCHCWWYNIKLLNLQSTCSLLMRKMFYHQSYSSYCLNRLVELNIICKFYFPFFFFIFISWFSIIVHRTWSSIPSTTFSAFLFLVFCFLFLLFSIYNNHGLCGLSYNNGTYSSQNIFLIFCFFFLFFFIFFCFFQDILG